MEKIILLQITGMHCVSCAMTIDGELEDMGVMKSKTSYVKGETSVQFDDDKISEIAIREKIESLGYRIG